LGDTDSERVFALITASIREREGDVTAGLVDAMKWLAAKVPIYAVNVLLSTATDMWALRYPESHELYVLERDDEPRTESPGPEFDLRTKRIHARSEHLCTRPSVVFASEPMNDDTRWRLLQPGELVHVDAALRVTRGVALPDPPRHLLHREDLSRPVQDAQHALPSTRRLA
jgi:glutamine amidotransferase